MQLSRVIPSEPSRRGSAPAGLVFWALGLLVFAGPFACKGESDQPQWDAADATRKTEFVDDEDLVRDLPFAKDLASLAAFAAEEEWDLEGNLVDLVTGESEARYGWESRALLDSDSFVGWRLESGRRTYERECAGCHARNGDGGGPAAQYLFPRPRNFRKREFKFQSAPVGGRPRREDLMRTVTKGLVGSAMPAFRLLPEEKRHDVVEYVRYLSIRGEFEQTLLEWTDLDGEFADPDEVQELVEDRWKRSNNPVTVPLIAETDFDQDSIERGRLLFTNAAACNGCHGDTGLGDGPTADSFRDAWGYPIRPRDLTTGQFRAGIDPSDIYRVIANGIGGTPMPGALGNNTPEEIWDLVHFVQHLTGKEVSR